MKTENGIRKIFLAVVASLIIVSPVAAQVNVLEDFEDGQLNPEWVNTTGASGYDFPQVIQSSKMSGQYYGFRDSIEQNDLMGYNYTENPDFTEDNTTSVELFINETDPGGQYVFSIQNSDLNGVLNYVAFTMYDNESVIELVHGNGTYNYTSLYDSVGTADPETVYKNISYNYDEVLKIEISKRYNITINGSTHSVYNFSVVNDDTGETLYSYDKSAVANGGLPSSDVTMTFLNVNYNGTYGVDDLQLGQAAINGGNGGGAVLAGSPQVLSVSTEYSETSDVVGTVGDAALALFLLLAVVMFFMGRVGRR